ncbi:MAG TPA: sugar phosphate isomerase/epimerase [Novosphingobium sp.]
MKRDTAIKELCLEPLALLDVSALDVVDLAAAAGFGAMSLWVHSPTPHFVAPCLIEPGQAGAMARRLADAGLRVCNLEVFRVGPGVDIGSYEASLALGAELGAATTTAIAKDGSDETAEALARFTRMAARHGVRVNVEFLSYRGPCSLTQAMALVDKVGDAGTGILVDILHLVRSGGSISEVSALAPGIIGHVQLCDGPTEVPQAGLEHESAFDRMLPGTGSFPLAPFIAALPDMALGLEIPRSSVAFEGMTPAERAKRLFDATLTFLELSVETAA